MIKSNVDINGTKEKLKSYLTMSVEVKVNLGRNKYAYYVGKITGMYPALFTVTPVGGFNGKTSFSYSEYMCGMVELKEKTE